MTDIPPILEAKLMRSAEAKLRFEGSSRGNNLGWQAMSAADLGQWLFLQAPQGSPYTLAQFVALAQMVIDSAHAAADVMANLSTGIVGIPVSTGIPANFPTYEYRVVVVGKNTIGEEVYSTLTYVYSNGVQTGQAVIDAAINQIQTNLTPPGFPTVPLPTPQQIVNYDGYVVSASRKQ